MAEMYEMPREMCEMPRADSPDAVYAEVTPVGEPEAASQGEKTGKSSRLKLLLVALLVINFIFTGVCFYMVMEMKLGIVNYERQIGELKSKQIGNATTEPRPIDGPAGIMGETGTQGPKGKNANVGSYGITGLNSTDERDGIKGKCGMKGEKGQKGLPGQSGKDGRIGPRGDTGSMGIKGQKGDIGPTGLRGETGQKGNPGNTPPKGNKGEVGSTGPIGPKGKTGAIGQKGLKGNIGNVGNTGAKGTKGQKGESDVATLQRRIQELQRVRLVNGGSYYGRVEVFHNGIWGTVCDDDWDTNDAAVFCRMMGFKGANAAPGSANYGQGSGQIWLDDVNCGGSEINIDDCSKNSWGSQNCDHSEDAGVTCIH